MREYGSPSLIQSLWQRFGAIGNLAASLATRSRALHGQADLAYTTGMFHGTGCFILVKRYPVETHGLEQAGAQFEERMRQLDQRQGTDHAAISALIARNWRLPTAVTNAIAHQDQIPADLDEMAGRLAHLLRLAITLHDGGTESEAWPAQWETTSRLLGLDLAALEEVAAGEASAPLPGTS